MRMERKHRLAQDERNTGESFPKLSQIKLEHGGGGGYAPPKGRIKKCLLKAITIEVK